MIFLSFANLFMAITAYFGATAFILSFLWFETWSIIVMPAGRSADRWPGNNTCYLRASGRHSIQTTEIQFHMHRFTKLGMAPQIVSVQD